MAQMHTNETQINKGLHWEQRDMTAGWPGFLLHWLG